MYFYGDYILREIPGTDLFYLVWTDSQVKQVLFLLMDSNGNAIVDWAQATTIQMKILKVYPSSAERLMKKGICISLMSRMRQNPSRASIQPSVGSTMTM